MINRGSLGCKWSSFKKRSNSPSHRESPLDTRSTSANKFYMNASLFPSSRLKTSPELCLLGGGSFRCWITRLCDLALHSPSGGDRYAASMLLRLLFLNPVRPAKGYGGRDLSSVRLSAQVWRWNYINGHVERWPQVHRGACVRIKSRLLQILPRTLQQFILSCLRFLIFWGPQSEEASHHSEKNGLGDSLTLL